MNTEIQLSEALAFYLERNVNTNAVEQVIDIKASKAYTVGMTWDEIESLNQARLAVLKVQVDYWSLMREVWDLTWGAAVTDLLKGPTELDADDYDNERSLEFVWENGFYKQLGMNDGTLVLRVYFDAEQLTLSFYFEDSESVGYEISNNLVLCGAWDAVPEDDERKTSSKLLPIRGKTTVDVEPMRKAAREVLEKLIVQAGVGRLVAP